MISCWSSHCYLPQRHHRPAADVCWSCQTYRWTLPLSEEQRNSQRNSDDWYWMPWSTLWTLVAQTIVTLSSLECMASTCGNSNEFSTLQRVWSSVCRSSTASHPWYVTSCIGCRFNTGIPLSAWRRTRLPVDHVPTSLREYRPTQSTFGCTWRSGCSCPNTSPQIWWRTTVWNLGPSVQLRNFTARCSI